MELKNLFTYQEESRDIYKRFLKTFNFSLANSSQDYLVFVNSDTNIEVEFFFIDKWVKYSIRYYDKKNDKMLYVYNYFWNRKKQTEFYFIGGEKSSIDYFIKEYVNGHWFSVSLQKFVSVLCSKKVADVVGNDYFMKLYDKFDKQKIFEEKIVIEHIGGKYMYSVSILGYSVIDELTELGYQQIEDNETLMIFEHKETLCKIVIKQNNGNYTVNFENRKDEKFLKNDWYLGNKDGVCCVDIFTIMEKPDFKNFCEVKLACEQTLPNGFENVRVHEGKHEGIQKTMTQKHIEVICDSLSDLLIYKNQKYGNSALEPKNIFYKGNAETSILIRLDDKLGRIINNTDEIRVNDVCDIIGYLVLYLVLKNITREDIEKLKD